MKIKSLQISNVLSFKHYDDIANAEKITFEDGLNVSDPRTTPLPPEAKKRVESVRLG